jgi:hypothetical protein
MVAVLLLEILLLLAKGKRPVHNRLVMPVEDVDL